MGVGVCVGVLICCMFEVRLRDVIECSLGPPFDYSWGAPSLDSDWFCPPPSEMFVGCFLGLFIGVFCGLLPLPAPNPSHDTTPHLYHIAPFQSEG